MWQCLSPCLAHPTTFPPASWLDYQISLIPSWPSSYSECGLFLFFYGYGSFTQTSVNPSGLGGHRRCVFIHLPEVNPLFLENTFIWGRKWLYSRKQMCRLSSRESHKCLPTISSHHHPSLRICFKSNGAILAYSYPPLFLFLLKGTVENCWTRKCCSELALFCCALVCTDLHPLQLSILAIFCFFRCLIPIFYYTVAF